MSVEDRQSFRVGLDRKRREFLLGNNLGDVTDFRFVRSDEVQVAYDSKDVSLLIKRNNCSPPKFYLCFSQGHKQETF